MAQIQLNRQLSASGESLTSARIREVVDHCIVFVGCSDVDAAAVTADLETAFQTLIGAERVLSVDEDGYEPWLPKKKLDISWDFWMRYEQYLLQEHSWPQSTLDRLDATTDRILALLTDPKRPGSWDRRGMVVGHVQSGKTANYVGLITKAADAGYKLIVVLAGFHKSLRSQTQIRLEEGFLGYVRGALSPGNDGQISRIGVGKINPGPRADSITTRLDDGDFKRQVASNFGISPGGRPLLFVIKKNGSVLRNLLEWVRWAADARDEQGRRFVKNVPLLVIDDEADQGSIDTREGAFLEDGSVDPEHSPTVLNQRIRELLHLFDQSAYVGYTATPFANIFIHEGARTDAEGEDLFPRSFIISLPTPSNYVGPAQVFGYEDQDGHSTPGLPIVRVVRDHARTLNMTETEGWMPPRHKSGHRPRHNGHSHIPPSLRQAIHAFVLACAARIARGQSSAHNSMLIHVTRFTAVQQQVAEQVGVELQDVQRRLRYEAESDGGVRGQLRSLWEGDFEVTSSAIADRHSSTGSSPMLWEEVEPFLARAALSITIREINGQAGEVLDYVNHEGQGLNVIAIGGDKLSRGLTLEGLTISYFLRASRMYDTLMQMGRWFGYRPGYLDLCRLYTTPDLTEWYSHIAAASEELREDFGRMAASGSTPREFGHRVKSHPLMVVTSQVKMRHGTPIDVTFSGDISETINFWRTRRELDHNWRAAQTLIEAVERSGITPRRGSAAEDDESTTGPFSYHDVPAEAIIDFLTGYQEHDASKKVKTKLLAEYVRRENEQQRLTHWTILLASGSAGRSLGVGSASWPMATRAWHFTAGNEDGRQKEWEEFCDKKHFRIRRLVSPPDEARDLTQAQQQLALERTIAAWQEDPKDRSEPRKPSGPELRRVRTTDCGLLILYALDSGSADGDPHPKVEPTAAGVPVVGFAISFPEVAPGAASKVRYVVNNVYYQQEFGRPGFEEEDWS